MRSLVNILLDTMGGDNAPYAMVRGALDALKIQEGFTVTLLGDKAAIENILINEEYNKDRLHIRHTTQEITNNDKPTKAIKIKTDSSMVVGFNMLKNKEGDVFISTGSSGALLVGAVTILRRIPGIDRPALGTVIPTHRPRCQFSPRSAQEAKPMLLPKDIFMTASPIPCSTAQADLTLPALCRA